ncbi:hypothetical protein EHQ43_06845 [Leptospira bouyouniensis]|uniref:DUF4430 domain-containing protein n=1 Tax=Leptospira bouyouniensis TaxID=2484911 RepID=A0A7I0HT34_9LEPT|nr:hypothetical protein EHQ10_15035 [Leptospira bouyouniensis]TGL07135.1 hypothetical protein EHQ43_06845 [Leptospira bouyouniensis]
MNPIPLPKLKLNQLQRMCNSFVLIIFVTSILFFVSCFSSTSANKTKEPTIQIQFISRDFEENKLIPSGLFESKDLLFLLAELSKKEDPSMRFISTNRTEEIMEVNGVRNTWNEGWVVYVNGERMDGVQMKRGVKVRPTDQIQIRYEAVERVFGRPIN